MKEEFNLYSDGSVKGIKWEPEKIKGCLLIFHGITEYIERYDKIARELNKSGIVVYGFDMRGHGKTTDAGTDLPTMLQDIEKLIDKAREEQPGMSITLLGYSYGSYLLRVWLNRKDEIPKEIEDIILIGTGSQNQFRLWMAKRYVKEGNLDALTFGLYNRHFQPAETKADWLCKDKEELKGYLQDENIRDGFTYELFQVLMEAMEELNKKQKKHNVKLHFMSGEDDPASGFCKGVRKVAQKYQKEGYETTLRIYEGARHDLLRETCWDKALRVVKMICIK